MGRASGYKTRQTYLPSPLRSVPQTVKLPGQTLGILHLQTIAQSPTPPPIMSSRAHGERNKSRRIVMLMNP